MKKLLFLLLGILILNTANAQDEETTFSFTFGSAIPVGSFASKSINENNAGLAKSGLSMDLNFTYTPDRIFGLTGGLYFSNLSVDDGQTALRLENMLKKIYPSLSSNDKKEIRTNDWRWGSLLIGPSIGLPLGKGTFDLKAFTGLQYTYLPYQEMRFTDSANKKVYYVQTSDQNKIAIPFRFSSALSYPLKENVKIKLQADYYRASVKHTVERAILNTGTMVNTQSGSETFKIPIQTINIGIGLVYTL